MKIYKITNNEARKFLLVKHGLMGEYQYYHQEDIVKFLKEVGCIQYDPIDVCGKNAELVLNSRFKEFQKKMLYEELYEKRSLIEHWDKNMSIYLSEDWPYFKRIRDEFKENIRYKDKLFPFYGQVKEVLREKEFINAKDLEFNEQVNWYWSPASTSKAVLEAMYYQGEILIHHRQGTKRYFTLPNKIIDSKILAMNEEFTDYEYTSWRVLRRIKAIGLLPNKASYAFIFIRDLKTKNRNSIFESLLKDGQISKVYIEGIKDPLYIASSDEELLQEVLNGQEYLPRCEFLAPLDNLLWDRSLIKSIFDFNYTWEIYYPKEKRKYGYYVLPILYGTNFIGRIEAIMNRKEKILKVKNLYLETGIVLHENLKKLLEQAIHKLMFFNEAEFVEYEDGYLKY